MDRIQLRRDTAARWAEINPVLLEGEVGFETDTRLRKIGDGVNRWNELGYLKAEGIVNDLTTGGADKALSAEMGKELDGKITELESEVNGRPNYIEGYYLDTSGKEVADDYCVSEYIAIDSASLTGGVIWTYGVYKAGASLILYNNSKGIIDFYGALNSASQRKLSQSQLANASYIRISFAKETGGKLENANNWDVLYQSERGQSIKEELNSKAKQSDLEAEINRAKSAKSNLDDKFSKLLGKFNYTEGFYLDASDKEVAASDYCVSEYIEIDSSSLTGGVMWIYGIYNSSAKLVLYNAEKSMLDNYGMLADSTQRKLSQSQLMNASFVRISFAKETGGKLEDVNNWNVLYQSGQTDGADYLHSQIVSLLGKDGARVNAATLSDGQTLSVNDFARSIQSENKISMTASITSWGGGIVIGKGTTDWGASYVTIDDTNVVVSIYQGGSTITKYRKTHGLTFAQFVKVVLNQSSHNLSIKIITLNGYFEGNISDFEYKFNGFPRITSVGASLTNVSLGASNPSYQYPIWMFGDSYFGADTDNREMYWLREQWGFDKFMLNGFAGRASGEALNELSRCLKFGCPKYLVWCLGMNDDILEDYKSAISELKELCEQNDITLILQTIPSVPVRNKVAMNQYIKSLGLRYIDVNAAVGAGDTGNWWGTGTEYDYLSSDGVHPSVYGARAIAAQFLVDMPEIMQYVA